MAVILPDASVAACSWLASDQALNDWMLGHVGQLLWSSLKTVSERLAAEWPGRAAMAAV